MLFFLNVLGLQDSNIDVRLTVRCYECDTPRCIYSKEALADRQKRKVRRKLEGLDYTCGLMIAVEGIYVLQYCFLMKNFE